MYSVPSSHGLQSTMFKLIIPRGYDSDEASENPAAYPQKRSVPSDAIPENESKNIASINDTGGTTIKRSIFDFVAKKYRNNKLVSSLYRNYRSV